MHLRGSIHLCYEYIFITTIFNLWPISLALVTPSSFLAILINGRLYERKNEKKNHTMRLQPPGRQGSLRASGKYLIKYQMHRNIGKKRDVATTQVPGEQQIIRSPCRARCTAPRCPNGWRSARRGSSSLWRPPPRPARRRSPRTCSGRRSAAWSSRSTSLCLFEFWKSL